MESHRHVYMKDPRRAALDAVACYNGYHSAFVGEAHDLGLLTARVPIFELLDAVF